MTMNGGNDVTVHAVLVPFPAQGHVNALIHLANLLAARGFSSLSSIQNGLRNACLQVQSSSRNCTTPNPISDFYHSRMAYRRSTAAPPTWASYLQRWLNVETPWRPSSALRVGMAFLPSPAS
ncbi:hypothetical protein SUGI_0657740 [Cryptomeria japonica]|nr:hypothetical protein SUGI_0657740 [Cryptomeria japonica]